ncbi:hypothetical protein DL240_02970 [Lujinxingia litoralis]|uniref:Uncharacterized protein n=1 Tax=Lujinxingia litoralis TaxID=2211119 RepID=A0A328C988_9DELT|nr:hypothetical protein [Lujinxingia litoralis]RAL25187.1 hypothetical protein DL240_02970 [Lujinxingia litoralis]
MEIRCEACREVGPAAEVRPGARGLELVCAGCGHANLLEVGSPGAEGLDDAQQRDGQASGRAPGPVARASGRAVASSPRAASELADARPGYLPLARAVLLDEAMARLVPEPGPGKRCPKCAHLTGDDEHCRRCGLSLVEAARFAPGQAPWEQVSEERAEVFLRFNALWDRAEAGDAEALEVFSRLAADEGMVEEGIRRLRRFLVAHPEHPGALDALRHLALALQARVTIAASQAAASAESFGNDVEKVRGVLMGITLAMCAVILLLLSAVFWDKC